jgi:hypothetical protein
MAHKKVISRNLLCWKGCLSFVAVALLSLLTPLSHAATRFDVFLGYDGMLPDHGWFPITCELQNDGPSYNAVIEVSAQQMGREQTRSVQVDLPRGTLKRVVIPLFTAAPYWNVRLLDDRGKVRAEQTMLQARVLPPDLPLVAGLCRTVQGLPVFPELPGRYLGASTAPYRAARLEAALFPDNPIAMESIGLLYLNSQKALELTEPQATALMAWLQNGGHLVVGVEQISDITGSHWLKDLMPCDLTSVRNLADHHQLEDWLQDWRPGPTRPAMPVPRGRIVQPRNPNGVPPPRAANPVRPSALGPVTFEPDAEFEAAALPILTGSLRDGTVVIGDADSPLAVTAARGRGQITILTFSPEREPFVSWKNRGYFWAKLAGIPRERLELNANNPNQARLGSDGIFGAMIDSKQVRKLPLSWLLLLLVAYLVVIGPLDQYWLKKINRQMLTWITFPLYVVAFSGLIYLIGFHLRAGELEWNELNIVDVLPGTERAVLRGETYVSIYSPVNASYQMLSAQPYATLRGEYSGNYGGGQESSQVAVHQTGNNFEADASVPVWTSQLFVSEWLQGAPQSPVEMTASRQANGDWQVTVVNNTDNQMPRAKAVLGPRLFDLGALPPHQTKSFSFTLEAGTPVSALVNQYANPFRNAINMRHQSFGNNVAAIGDNVEGAMAACFLSQATLDQSQPYQGMPGFSEFAVYQNLDLSRYLGQDHAILLAWDAGHSLVEGLNRFSVKRLHRDSLLRLVVPVKPAAPARPST